MAIFTEHAEFDSPVPRGIYIDGKLVIPYLSEEQVKEHHNLYVYVEILDNGNIIILKFGKAKISIYERYYNGQSVIKEYNRCIWVGDSDLGDEYGHKKLQNIAAGKDSTYVWYPMNHSDENYKMLNGIESVKEFINDLEKIYNTKCVREKQSLYKDIFDFVINTYPIRKKYNILNLCPRWGKTRTNLSFAQIHNYEGQRVSIIASYVGTVRNSYLKDIETLENYKDVKFIDLSEVNAKNIKTKVKEINKWLNENEEHHVILYLALTGTGECYQERIKLIKKLKQYRKVMFIEEADFGAHCDNKNEDDYSQLMKTKNLIKRESIDNVYITTGTGFSKLEKFIPEDEKNDCAIFTKDYIFDILGQKF